MKICVSAAESWVCFRSFLHHIHVKIGYQDFVLHLYFQFDYIYIIRKVEVKYA